METRTLEILNREMDAAPDSFTGLLRFGLRWDHPKFDAMCEAMRSAIKEYAASDNLPRDLSQLFWYCGTFIPPWVQQNEFRVGQRHIDYKKSIAILRELGNAWFKGD